MRIIEAAELERSWGPKSQMLAACHFGEGIDIDLEGLTYRKPQDTSSAIVRVYHFQLHETAERWWELEITIYSVDPRSDDPTFSYSVWEIPALGVEAEDMEDCVVEWTRVESQATLPGDIDRELMQLAIDAVRSFVEEHGE